MEHLKFSSSNGEFAKDIRSGINQYFKTNKKNRHCDSSMVAKTVIMISIYLIPFILLGTGLVTDILLIYTLYLTAGIGMAGIGMNVMHDALHGSYSKYPWVNRLMGQSINLIGASVSVWKIQHNVLHHTYTNVSGADDDLNTNKLLRFSPDKEKLWIHRYQYIYIWFLYPLLTIQWVTSRDFIRMKEYKKLGFYNKPGEYQREFISTLLLKIGYFFISLVLPLIMISQPWYIIFLGFLSMHFLTGTIISVIFQTAHITPDAMFPTPNDNGSMDDHWYIHQLLTTCNYAPKSTFFSWYIGGLNHQIEHHLMPNICHVHYKGLSKIVRSVAKKHNLPYHYYPTFFDALCAHQRKLISLGKREASESIPTSSGLSILMK